MAFLWQNYCKRKTVPKEQRFGLCAANLTSCPRGAIVQLRFPGSLEYKPVTQNTPLYFLCIFFGGPIQVSYFVFTWNACQALCLAIKILKESW